MIVFKSNIILITSCEFNSLLKFALDIELYKSKQNKFNIVCLWMIY